MGEITPEQLARVKARLDARRVLISVMTDTERAEYLATINSVFDDDDAADDMQRELDEAAVYASLGGAEGARALLGTIETEGYTPFDLDFLDRTPETS